MQKQVEGLIFSATDLVNHLECVHLGSLDLLNLAAPEPRTGTDEYVQLLQARGFGHEQAYLRALQRAGRKIVEIRPNGQTLQQANEATREAMRAEAEVIYQATLCRENFAGHADFLCRVPRPSKLGDYSYEVIDTKLARSPRAKFLIQLCFYTGLLAEAQGAWPYLMHLVLGDGTERNYRVQDFLHYYQVIQRSFDSRMRGDAPPPTYPQPCAHCELCHWQEHCEARWHEDDHLCQVANITRVQIRKLQEQGIYTLAQLANLTEDIPNVRLAKGTLQRLSKQAALQLTRRETGANQYELLAYDPCRLCGLARLPKPDEGDIFLDLEGDPLELGGLEYLFGMYYREQGEWRFWDLWAHDTREEKQSFTRFMDFVTERLRQHPNLHIYHYGHYEETALKRLMSLYGTREAELDQLLREHRLVDLYRVVREALMISEPRYSIKNLERFYMEARTGEVKQAGTSIVYYEKWRDTHDSKLLDQIRDYNRDDCRSTYLLLEWLLGLRPADLSWFSTESEADSDSKSTQRQEDEARLARYEQQLFGELPEDRAEWGPEHHVRELTCQLLEFHRRAAKPQWWTMFSRREMTVEELIEDPDCLAGLVLDLQCPGVPVKKRFIYTYGYPEQEFKLKAGESVRSTDTLENLGTIEAIDEAKRQVQLKLSGATAPATLSIGPTGPVNTKALREALYRFADSVIADNRLYPALLSIIHRELPRIRGQQPGKPIVDGSASQHLAQQILNAASHLDNSYLFIQGPPGAGKTYLGSHLIVDLLRQGFRVGVSSNSHKAINNLLHAVEKRAHEAGFQFRGIKKSNKSKPDSCFNGDFIEDIFDNSAADTSTVGLIAGTAWLFARPALEQSLDYLCIDEAGQVALANLIAMGMSARNLILLGDQMQLPQPIQGIHPGRSGESALEFLLDGEATIAPEKGVFLDTTWRLHDDLCRFISEAVYDKRLRAEVRNRNQRLILKQGKHPGLRPTGISFVAVNHDGCSQCSREEAHIVESLYLELLNHSYQDREGNIRQLIPEEILVVAPYNMQVNLLQQVLPEAARVGTVDKFQGQEAQVVIISLATSSGDYLPRQIEFLYSKHRLNVAITRARCLAILVASPELMKIKCETVEQMALVNTLCWINEYSSSHVSRDTF